MEQIRPEEHCDQSSWNDDSAYAESVAGKEGTRLGYPYPQMLRVA